VKEQKHMDRVGLEGAFSFVIFMRQESTQKDLMVENTIQTKTK
jgi:hypothetical protein